MEIIKHHFKSLDSTNNWAKDNISSFKEDCITIVTADMQTAGRGRFKRTWISPSNQNIYATFCFFITKNREQIANLPQVMALAIAKALQDLGFNPKLKWPNDILLNDKKVSGILTETVDLEDRIGVLIGVGINVNMPQEELQSIDRPATSLLVEGGITIEREKVFAMLEKAFCENLTLFLKDGFNPFLEEYRGCLVHKKGSLISFQSGNHLLKGSFIAINNDGSLCLRLENGEIKSFVSGEINN